MDPIIETREDLEDLRPWQSITEVFVVGFEGTRELIARQIVYDNGVVAARDFVFDRETRIDNPDGEANAKPWSRVDIVYNSSGDRVNKTTTFDDGRETIEDFASGILTRRLQLDDDNGNKPWSSITTEFDASGAITSKRTSFDNGRSREEIFENGVLSKRIDYDPPDLGVAPCFNPPCDPPDPIQSTAAWSRIETDYNDFGQIEERSIIFDDGRIRDETFENGIIAERVTVDPTGGAPSLNSGADTPPSDANSSLYDWQRIVVTFDETGTRTQRLIEFDNGDVDTIFFSDGVKQERQRIDLADDDPWLAQRVTFDPDGNTVERINYFDEVPLDFFRESLNEPSFDFG